MTKFSHDLLTETNKPMADQTEEPETGNTTGNTRNWILPKWLEFVQLFIAIMLLVFGALRRDTDILLVVIGIALLGIWIDLKSAL